MHKIKESRMAAIRMSMKSSSRSKWKGFRISSKIESSTKTICLKTIWSEFTHWIRSNTQVVWVFMISISLCRSALAVNVSEVSQWFVIIKCELSRSRTYNTQMEVRPLMIHLSSKLPTLVRRATLINHGVGRISQYQVSLIYLHMII